MLGQTVQQLRVRAGLSQAQLAQKVGVSVAKLQEWEVYGGEPGSGTLSKLAEALSVPQDELAAELAKSQQARQGRVVSAPREKP